MPFLAKNPSQSKVAKEPIGVSFGPIFTPKDVHKSSKNQKKNSQNILSMPNLRLKNYPKLKKKQKSVFKICQLKNKNKKSSQARKYPNR